MDTVIKMIDVLQKGEPMRDLIDRQAAIDAIRASTSKYTGFMEMEMYTDDDAVEAIEGLPAAQPEIIRCGQCKYAEVADKEDTQDGYTCQFHRGSIWFSGSYCSWAERRTE